MSLLVSACNTCGARFDVVIPPDAGHLIAQLADEDGFGTCPRLCGGRVNLTTDMVITTVVSDQAPIQLTAVQFYRAVNGGGLPDEIPNSGEFIVALFKAHAVKDVLVEAVGDRVYLHEIRMTDGSTIHLTAGGRGAQVFKVSREP